MPTSHQFVSVHRDDVHNLRTGIEGALVVLVDRHGDVLVGLEIHDLYFVSLNGKDLGLSIRGTWTLVLTGPTRDFFAPVKMLAASMFAFADPCFPGLDVLIEMILQGSPSMLTYLPILSSLISFISQSAIFHSPLGYFAWLVDVFRLTAFQSTACIL